MVIPDGSPIGGSRFRNLAGVDVRIEEYDPVLTPEMVRSFEGWATVRGVGNITCNVDFVPFAVVWDEQGTQVPVVRLWYFEDTMFLIDDRFVMPDVIR